MQKNIANPLNNTNSISSHPQQQNININISYNLNTHKLPKTILPGKKLNSKNKKISGNGIHGIGNQFFTNLALNTINQGKKTSKKQNLHRKSNQNQTFIKQGKTLIQKKTNDKKKQSNQINAVQYNQGLQKFLQCDSIQAKNSKEFLKKNIQNTDIFKGQATVTRKLKTQGSVLQTSSGFKRQKKILNSQYCMPSKNGKLINSIKQCNNSISNNKLQGLNFPTKKNSSNASRTPKNKKSVLQIKEKQKRIHTQQNQFVFSQNIASKHNKSCMLYSSKKQGLVNEPNFVEAAQHIISTYVNCNSQKIHKKRSQSAYAISKNDKKLVSKILDMSIISSQLGSSQLISSQRMKSGRNGITKKKLGLKVDQFDEYKHYQHYECQKLFFDDQKKVQKRQQIQVLPGNALRQYLNSIDLRVIKNIQSDTANVAKNQLALENKQKQKQREIIKNEFKTSSLQNKSQTLVSKMDSNKNQSKSNIVYFYNQLFQNALNKKKIEEQQRACYLNQNLGLQKKKSFQTENGFRLKKEHFIIENYEQNQGDQSQNKIQNQVHLQDRSMQSNQVQRKNELSNERNEMKLNFNNYKNLFRNQAKTENLAQQQTLKRVHQQNVDQFQFIPHANSSRQKRNQQNECNFQKIEVMVKNDKSQKIQKQKFMFSLHQCAKQQKNESKQQICKQNQKQISREQNQTNEQNQFVDQKNGLSEYKETHIERWNNINKILSKKINTQDYNQEIMNELIKQSNWNKKWIQQQQKSNEKSSFINKNQYNQFNQEEDGIQSFKQKQQQDKDEKTQIQLNQIQKLKQKSKDQLKQTQNFFKNIKNNKTKSSNQHKKNKSRQIQPTYDQVCWQYDPEQLKKQIQNMKISKNNVPSSDNSQIFQKYFNHNLQSSPYHFSEEANASGQDEYDSRKYSEASIFKDQIVEDQNKTSKQFDNQKNQLDKNENEADSLDGDQENQVSYQEKQIESQARWVRHNDFGFGQMQLEKEDQKINVDIKKQLIKKDEGLKLTKVQKKEKLDAESCNDCHDKNDGKYEKERKDKSSYLQCQLSNFVINKKALDKNQQNLQKGFKASDQRNSKNETQKDTLELQQGIIKKAEESSKQASTNYQKQNQNEELIDLSDVLLMISQQEKDIQDQYEKITQPKSFHSHRFPSSNQQHNLHSPASNQQQNHPSSNQFKNVFSQHQRKKLTHIVEDIILQLIRQFAKDISYILKKSSSYEKKIQKEMDDNSSPFRLYQQSNQFDQELSPFQKADQYFEVTSIQTKKQQIAKKNQFVGKCFGIDTSFASVQKYLKEFKKFLLQNEKLKKQMIKNINKDIGPNSLQILSYLRPQYDLDQNNSLNQNQSGIDLRNEQQQQICQDEDGLFVVPSQGFSQFQNYLQQKRQQENKKLEQEKQVILTQKQKRNTNYWHRGIYESWNQFLDYQRPYGINGKPYDWIQEGKKFREIQMKDIQIKLQKATQKLLQAISLPSGILYDKFDIPALYSDLSEEQKIFLNQERLSRMLAIELFESEQTWINYNDEMAQLLVQLSRIIEDRVFFEMSTQFKKVMRKRNLVIWQGQNREQEEMINMEQNETNEQFDIQKEEFVEND